MTVEDIRSILFLSASMKDGVSTDVGRPRCVSSARVPVAETADRVLLTCGTSADSCTYRVSRLQESAPLGETSTRAGQRPQPEFNGRLPNCLLVCTASGRPVQGHGFTWIRKRARKVDGTYSVKQEARNEKASRCYSDHSPRYARLRYCSASGAFGISIDCGSYRMARFAWTETTPRSSISVSGVA